jgi:phosphonate transport system substrate-binding protein
MTMTEPPLRKRAPIWVLVLSAVIPAAIIGSVLWYLFVTKPGQQELAVSHDVVLRISGLSRPTVNKLDEKYKDTDGDLVADPPTDASDLIDPPKLVFSYVPIPADEEEPERYKVAFAEFVQHVTKVTGKPCEYRLYHSLNDQLKAMRDAELHFSGFNTGGVPIAVNLSGFVPVCKLATGDGVASYRMNLIVPADSPIRNVSDLIGHEVTLTEPSSKSGYKAPLVLLRNAYQREPVRDYILRYSGSHDESIRGIGTKKYEAAAVASDVLKRAVSRGEIKTDQYRVIYESEAFPTACFGLASRLKPELAAKLRQALLEFDWKATGMEKEFSSSDQSKFVPANFKDDWSLVRKIDDDIGAKYVID